MKKIKDNFSNQSALYQKFRPTYPEALIAFLCECAPGRNLAWDCATGNGQIASQLAKTFKSVIATDVSEEQLKKAPTVKNVTYLIERAEKSSLVIDSVDLIVVAQALHWFDFDAFYTEAKRVLKKNGIIALIGYPLLTAQNSELNRIIIEFYRNIVGEYWDSERKYIDEGYATVPFPFEEFEMPKFEIRNYWSSQQLIGYFESWSAVGHYQKQHHTNPVDLIREKIEKIFASAKLEEVRFEIVGRLGRHL